MYKTRRTVWLSLLFVCSIFNVCKAQTGTKDFTIQYHLADKDNRFVFEQLKLQTKMDHQAAAMNYAYSIPGLLVSKGYPLASIDSIWETTDTLHLLLYVGKQYAWVSLQPAGLEPGVLERTGFMQQKYTDKFINFAALQQLQQRMLDYYEETGYPFARVYLDSVEIKEDKIFALLKAEKGILYVIDSIRIHGNLKLNPAFLQRYLGIKNGSIYKKENLRNVDKRMAELPYVQTLQPSDLSMLGTGAVLNIYANQKKSSQINFLIGFLPAANASDKLQLTGDVNLDLKNMFGNGEGILFKWQQLQPKSPRLNLGFNQPFIFNSPFGFNFLFDLFKKDSSFLQINAELGADFSFTGNQTGNLFMQFQNTGLLAGGVDTNQVKFTKKLPANIDLQSVNAGIQYTWNNTNYSINPRTGNDIEIKTSVGIKNIKKNQNIIGIKDNSFNYAGLYDSLKPRSYQLRIKTNAAHYFKLGKSATLKSGIQAGYYNSPSIFRNELFQIGGYKLMRGFDEESIYASSYAVFSAEYRYLLSLNSYLFAFVDQGFVQSKWEQAHSNNRFTGAGLGIFFETKAGLINLSFAAGKRNDVKLNLRQAAKIHFGYINYF